MRRVSRHWIHNVAQGARCEPQPMNEPLAALAERAAAALELDYAGIDIVPGRSTDPMQGMQVIEVNGVAAWHGLQRVTAFNIADALVEDLFERRCPGVFVEGHAAAGAPDDFTRRQA